MSNVDDLEQRRDEYDDELSIPLIPFDPRVVGPVDIVRSQYLGLMQWIDENPLASTAGAVGTFAIVVWAVVEGGISIPQPPNWLWVAVFTGALASVSAWYLGKPLAKGLYNPDMELVSVQNPKNGNQELIQLRKDRFRAMTVRKQPSEDEEVGEEVDLDYLHTVVINGQTAYEVDSYDPETNTAVASWQAGVSNSEIRRKKSEIDYIKQELESEADKAVELLANNPQILRKYGAEVSNRIIRVAQGIEVPDGQGLHQDLGALVDKHDPSEDLLGGEADTGTDGEHQNGHSDGETVEINLNGGSSDE